MKNKTLRIITIISTIVLMLCSCPFTLAVTNPASVGISDTSAFDDIGGRVIGGIKAIGILISVGILIVIGIKYMMGSAEEKAEYKKVMIPYLIGAVLIFAATQVAGMIYNFAISASTAPASKKTK